MTTSGEEASVDAQPPSIYPRRRIVGGVERGTSCREATVHFELAPSTAIK